MAACGAAVLLAAALIYALAQPEVLEKGSLLENADPVARVEVFERWTFYFDLEYERDRVSGDVVMSLLLAAVAAVSVLASAAGTRLGSTSRVEWFFALLSLGSAVLAIDELFALHESVGYNLDFLADLPGISHADDVLVLVGAAFALWFLWTFRGVIAGSRRAVALFGAAAGAVVVAAPLDAAGLRAVEELTELLGGALALAGTIALALDHLAALARDPQLSASIRR